MTNAGSQAYTYPVLGMSGAYLPPHDVFELRYYKFSKTKDNILVEGDLHMECGLIGQYLRKGWCEAYLLIQGAKMAYRKCVQIDTGRFSLTLDGAAIYADSCRVRCVIAAARDITNFFNPKYHNAEYGSLPLEVTRDELMATTGEIRIRDKADSVGSAIRVKSDDRLDKDVSFMVEFGTDADIDYIYIKSRPDTKQKIERMLKDNRDLFDNVVMAPVLVHALQNMSEYKGSAQWASSLAELCESAKVTQEEISERVYVAVQKLLYRKKTPLFERLKWDGKNGRMTGRDGATATDYEEEDDDYP